MILTHLHALHMGPGWRTSSQTQTICSVAEDQHALSYWWGWPPSHMLLQGEKLTQQASGSPGTQLHVQMLTLLMARLQHSNERNNVCFDRFDNSFISIVPKPSRQKATPLLQTGTISLCEVIETCGNNIWFKADSEVLFLNNNNIVFHDPVLAHGSKIC